MLKALVIVATQSSDLSRFTVELPKFTSDAIKDHATEFWAADHDLLGDVDDPTFEDDGLLSWHISLIYSDGGYEEEVQLMYVLMP